MYFGSINAAVKNVFIAKGNEAFSTLPINGSLIWSAYISKSKLAFAKGETYRVKIEYTSSIMGLLMTSSTNAVLNNKLRNGNFLECTMTISATAARLSTFNIGPASIQGAVTDPIPCEILEIGKFYSMSITDNSFTTMSSTGNDKGEISKLFFKKGTGAKTITFKGKDLANVKLSGNGISMTLGGLSISPAVLTQVSTNSFTITVDPVQLSSAAIVIDASFLAKIYDQAADKVYPWITYKDATMLPASGISDPGSGTPPGGIISSENRFEELPGIWVTLPSQMMGLRNFLKLILNVN